MVAASTTCATQTCENYGKSLGSSRKDYTGTLYTRGDGAIPISVVTLYCHGKCFFAASSASTMLIGIFSNALSCSKACNTTYRPNYSVTAAQSLTSVRQYHGGMPDYLEVSEHTYVEQELVRLFRAQMAFSQSVIYFFQ